jgi:hypothetical protein
METLRTGFTAFLQPKDDGNNDDDENNNINNNLSAMSLMINR